MLGENSHIVASDWLLWLNENGLLVVSDLASLGNLLPLINQLSTEASTIIDSDTMSATSSPIVFRQVDLPAEEQEYSQYSASSPGSESGSAASDSAMVSRLNTPQVPLVRLVRSPSPRRPLTVLSLHIPSPPPISECPTPSSVVSIVDYDDDNWSVAVDIDSVPPSQLSPRVPRGLHGPRHDALLARAGRVGLGLGLSRLDDEQRGAASKLLHTVPCPSSTMRYVPSPLFLSARPGP